MNPEIIDVDGFDDTFASSRSVSRSRSRTQPGTQSQTQTGTRMHRSTPQSSASTSQPPPKRQKTSQPSQSSTPEIIDLSFLSDADSDHKPDPINVDDPDIICTSVVVNPAKKRARELEKLGRKRNATVVVPASPPIQITSPRTRDVTLTNAAAQRAAALVSPLKPRGRASGSGGTGPPKTMRDFPSAITPAIEERRARPGNPKRPNDFTDSGISKKQKFAPSTPSGRSPQTTTIAVACSSRSRPQASSSSSTTSKLKRPAQHFEIDDSDVSFVEVEQPSINQVKAESPSVSVSAGKTVKRSGSRTDALELKRNVVMELGSDGEEVDIEYQRKKLKKQLRPWEGSESEGEDGAAYDYMYDAYIIAGSDSWIPATLQDDTPDPEPLSEAEETRDKDKPLPVHPDTSRWHPPRMTDPPIYIWDQLRMADNLHFKRRQRPLVGQLPNLPIIHHRDKDFEHLLRMKKTKWFRESPGSIKQIEQKGSWTVVASASLGGGVDQEGEGRPQHNRKGSLISWHKGVWRIPKGHQKKKDDYYKYYAVNDVKFDPTSEAFVSTGADKKLRVWNWQWLEPKNLSRRQNMRSQSPEGSDEDDDGYEPQNGWRNTMSIGFRHEPHDVLFKPRSSIFALAAKPVCFFDLSALASEGVNAGRLKSFTLAPKKHANSPHITGGMVWGTDSTDGHLFASTEPDMSTVVDGVGLYDGYHKVIDVNSMTVLHTLDASEAGDAITLDTTGDRLALATCAAANRHILRLYDVRTRQSKSSSMIELEPFSVRHKDFEGECNGGAFSPDGIYLAMSRNDNHTHVYDTRMLSKGPLFDYEHYGPTKAVTVTEDLYGVVKVQWVQSEVTRRMALLSAGEDGCVRLWDPLKAANNRDNGRVIAEVNSDIAHFSVGDPRAGEHQLIVGDCSGEVSCFDNVVI